MAQELISEMSALQAKNARLLQQLESVRVANKSIREATAQQNLCNSRLEEEKNELQLINLAQRVHLGYFD